jgi:glycosyltransferase involved in cell wall biosynthesis
MVPGANANPVEGVARHVHEISKRLGKKGFEVINIVPSLDGTYGAYLIDNSYTFLKIPVTSSQSISLHLKKIDIFFELALHYIRYKEIVRKLLKNMDDSLIIHTHGFYVVSQPKNGSKNYKRVATLHGSVPMDIIDNEKAYGKAAILNSLLRRVYKNADKYTALSERIKILAINSYRIDANRITVVPHGVDAKFFSAKVSNHEVEKIEERFDLNKPYKVLFLGQLHRGKKLDVLLRAIKILSSRRNDVQLVIRSGWGNYYHEVSHLIKTLDMESIVRWIKKPIYGADLRALYKASSAFVNIHMVSGVSTAMLEAMASGIPPIIYKNSSNKEIVDPSNGIILETIDPLELANAIEMIVEDKILAERLGHNAMSKMLKEYDWDDVVVPRYVSIYNS